jgi:hypothetical protein
MKMDDFLMELIAPIFLGTRHEKELRELLGEKFPEDCDRLDSFGRPVKRKEEDSEEE